MATYRQPPQKAGNKRKYDESTATDAASSKKVKASGLELAQTSTRPSSRSKESIENPVRGASNGSDSIEKVRKDNRIRTKSTDRKPSEHHERRKLKRKEKREQKKANKSLAKEKSKVDDHEQYHDAKEFVELAQRRQSWVASRPLGGGFLSHDPIFVQDAERKQYLISATRREIQLFSMADSLLVRSYPATEGRSVTSFALDSADDTLVHVAYDDDSVSTWDWLANSAALKGKELDSDIVGIASGLSKRDNGSLLFSINRVGTKSGVFRQGRLLHTTEQSLLSVQVIERGEYIMCRGQSALILGKSKGDSSETFTFVEFPMALTATCVDARLVPLRKPGEKPSKMHWALSVAVGFTDGRIHLYSDLSPLFDGLETSTPRTLHWHRQAVSAAKFSPDGNYLISGGTETVLVLWQLETGHRQYSPHLKAAIDRIVVNTTGNRYALQMGDHSIMVLNSSDFKATAYFAKLQAICPLEYRGEVSSLPRMSAILHPRDANKVLVAVPSTQPRSGQDVVARPFLQTFDAYESSHIRLQALQRNFTTEVAVAPNGNALVPPDVTFIAISHDGAWLATVDEWMPSVSDLDLLSGQSENLVEEQQKRREVHLRFWIWDQSRVAWIEEYTRETPHHRTNGEAIGAGKVLALASDPASNSFATIGEDGCVRIWSLRKDKVNGISKWRCQHTTELPYARSPFNMLDHSTPLESSVWHLAYSSDGSLLSAAYCKPLLATTGAPNEMYLINTNNGEIHSSKSGRTGGDVKGVAFLGRYYIALSTRAVYVWDFVDDRLMYKVKISSGRGEVTNGSNIQLASNQEGATFAVLVDNKVLIYDPQQNKRLYKQEFEQNIQTVLTSKHSLGYTLVMDDNTILIITPSWSSQTDAHSANDNLSVQRIAREAEAVTESMGSEEQPAIDLVASVRKEGSRQVHEEEEDDRPVVTPQSLAEICDPKADGTLPSVYDMFWGVVRLCSRKPVAKA